MVFAVADSAETLFKFLVEIIKAACGRSVDRDSLGPSSKKSDPNAETNGFAILAKLKHLDFDSVAETFRDGSDRYSGHLITCT